MSATRRSVMPKAAVRSGSKQPIKVIEKRSGGKPGREDSDSKGDWPEGMIPRVSVEVSEERRAMVADVARNLFPGTKSIGELKPGQRERWIAMACNLLYGDPEASREIEAAAEVITEAEIDLREKRAEAEEGERAERRALESGYWQLQERITTQRLEQEKARESNGCWLERLLMVMTLVSFGVALGMIVAAAKTGNANPDSPSFIGWALIAGGSGATGLLSLVLITLHRTRLSNKGLELLPEMGSRPSAPPGE